jgi:4-hydroxy-3-methylbut-2-enyl diphosphate reductase IspH
MKKEVIVSEFSGYCYGVERVMDLVDKNPNTNTLGPVIHNPGIIRQLEEKGYHVISDVKDAIGKVIVRAHGVPKHVKEEAKTIGLKLNKDGYQVVIIGRKGHPEIEGVESYADNPIVISTLEEARQLDYFEKLGVVVQTTMQQGIFWNIAGELKAHCRELMIKNTICDDTEKRQKAALDLAGKVDLMIVIGGFNSSNTRHLNDLCAGLVESYHVETESDLKEEWFAGKYSIGISAGASTPAETIEKIKKYIEGMD